MTAVSSRQYNLHTHSSLLWAYSFVMHLLMVPALNITFINRHSGVSHLSNTEMTSEPDGFMYDLQNV